jgi:hypothetical protein
MPHGTFCSACAAHAFPAVDLANFSLGAVLSFPLSIAFTNRLVKIARNRLIYRARASVGKPCFRRSASLG